MYQTQTNKEKFVLFLKLFIPVLIYQFANFSATFIDSVMTGQYSPLHLAGVSTASNLWTPFFALLVGMISALVPVVGQHLGRGNKEQIRTEFHQFLYLGLILSLILFLIMQFIAQPVLGSLGLEDEVLTVGRGYLNYMLIGIMPLVLFSICRSFFDALGLTRLSMYLMLLILPFNSFFNYMLIYGKFGMPRLGGAGAGLGTSLTYWAIFIVIIIVMALHPQIKTYHIWTLERIKAPLIIEDIRLGLPIGLQIFAEVAIFAVVGLFMAKFSSIIIAAHQAAMNFSSLMYAFPLSISTALAITISFEVGAERFQDANTYSRIGRLTAVGITSGTLLFLFLFRENVAAMYNSDPHFVAITAQFLTYSLFFQFADAYAAPVQGILRGYKDTTKPFMIGAGSYWLCALPLAVILEKNSQLGPFAYWIGLITGIFVCGLFLNQRLQKIKKLYY
ncbi:TPA: MATE family efflux transporter [Streptococcus agalactiae]